MDSYIIRIYHRDKKDPGKVVGVVEEVEGKRKKGFTTPEGLWRILAPPQRDPAPRGKTRKGAERRGRAMGFAEIMEAVSDDEEVTFPPIVCRE